MPFINSNLPLLKTADLTKQLRARDSGQSLLSLLDLAEQIIHGTGQDGRQVNVHFPKKEEWLVEWTVQRLKEEEGTGGIEARLSGRFWAFLLDLLKKTDRAVAAKCLRKHGFLQLVGMTIEECWNLNWAKERKRESRSQIDTNGDCEMKDSTTAENDEKELESIVSLLGNLSAVIEYLQQSVSGLTKSGESVTPVLRGAPELGGDILGGYLKNVHCLIYDPNKIDKDGVNPALRGIEAMISVWKGCVYGSADLKKTSAVFSKTCVLPIFQIFSSKLANNPYIASLDKLMMDYVFTPAFDVSASTDVSRVRVKPGASKPSPSQIAGNALKEELCTLLSSLHEVGKLQDVTEGLGKMLKVGIIRTTQGSTGKLTKVEVIERIFASLLEVVLGVKLQQGLKNEDNVFPEKDACVIHSLLTIISQSGLSISDATLRAIVDLAGNLPVSRQQDERSAKDVRWPIIELAITLDFDTFIISESTSLLDRLVFALSAFWSVDPKRLTPPSGYAQSASINNEAGLDQSDQTASEMTLRRQRDVLGRIIKLLLEGFLKARNLDGFLDFWRAELEFLYNQGGEQRFFKSIWVYEGLVSMFSNAVEKGYLSSKIDKIIRSYADSLSLKASLADIFVLDALLRGVRREETEEKLKSTGTLTLVFNILGQGVHTKGQFFTPWLGWQALYRVLQIDTTLLYSDPMSGYATQGALEAVASSSMKSPDQLGGLLACYQIVLMHLIYKHGAKQTEYELISKCMASSLAANLSTDVMACWDGTILSLTSQNFPVALLFMIVKQWLGAIEVLQTHEDDDFFIESFIKLTVKSLPSTESSEFITIRDVWDEMLKSSALFELPRLRDQIIRDVWIKQATNTTHTALFLDTVARFPVEAINSRAKNNIASMISGKDFLSICNKLSNQPQILNQWINKSRAIMCRLMDQPVSGQTLHEAPDKLIEWFNCFNWDAPELYPAQRYSLATAEKILRRAMMNKDQPKNIKYLNSLFDLLDSEIINTIGITPSWQLSLLLIRVCLSGSTETLKEGLEALRLKILKQAEAWLRDTKDPKITATLLSIYGEALVLATEKKEAQGIDAEKMVSRILLQWLPQWNNNSFVPKDQQEQLQQALTSLVGLRCLSPQTPESISPTIALILFALEHPSTNSTQKTTITASFTNMTSGLSLPVYLQAISTLQEACFPLSSSTPQDYYSLLLIILTSTKKPIKSDEISSLTNALSRIYSSIAISLHHCTTYSSFLTLASCMHTLLRIHSWSISQSNIDETLGIITICTSPGGPSFHIVPSDSSSPTAILDEIYTHLTRLLLTILLGHRLRLKGRYHLVIGTLQSLLRCLYSPALYRKKSDKPIHPPWLTSSSLSSQLTKQPQLTHTSGAAYARLLTTLCDPVASTVSRKITNTTTTISLLTSHTTLAKKEISRYIPYVLMEYIYWQLQPHRVFMQNDIRESLSQGIYAMFAVMKSEEGTLRWVNAALDAQGRALFKKLFDDWGKFGVESLR